MLITTFFYAFFLGIASGIIATVYINIIPYEEFFSFWWRFGNRYESRWFFNPIWGCVKCFSGQFSFWYYIFSLMKFDRVDELTQDWRFPACFISLGHYSIGGHLLAVCTAIFSSIIFTHFLNSAKQ